MSKFEFSKIILHYNNKVYNMDDIYDDENLFYLVNRVLISPNKIKDDDANILNSKEIDLHIRITRDGNEIFIVDKEHRTQFEHLFPPIDLA